MKIMRNNTVCVTGMGVVSGIGANIDQFTQSLRQGNAQYLIDNLTIPRRHTLASYSALMCCEEAWQHAQLNEKKIDGDKIGIIVGGQNINQNFMFNQHDIFKQDPDYLLPSYAIQFLDTDLVGLLSEQFKIHGEGFTIGGASASGNMAIIQGMRLIEHGHVDACVVIGALADLSPLELQAFKQYGALSCETRCNPFDVSHSGFVYGQASACLILESLHSAKKRQVATIGSLLGYGMCLDGHRLADPNFDGEVLAMQKALDAAHKKPKEIDYLNPHGTSSVLGDETEARAIKKVFDDNITSLWINNTKSLTGHCLWSAGVVEAIAVLIQMQHGFLHPNPFLEIPIEPALQFVGRESIPATLTYALSNSFGFGGINTSIVLGNSI